MKNKRRVLVVVISCLLLLIVAPYVVFESETTFLDDHVRKSLPGSFVRLTDGIVHYEINGRVSARVVVLVHGFSVPYYIWDPTYQALSDAGFRVLRYDLYGRGYSDRPNKEYGVGLFVAQLYDLLESLGIDQPVDLVGVSLGAPVIADFYCQHSSLVHSLVFIDPLVSGITEQQVFPLNVPGIGEYLMGAFLGPFLLPHSQSGDFFHPELFPYWESKYRDQMKYRGFKRALLSTIRSMPHMKTLPWYSKIGNDQLPVLLLYGEGDKTVPIQDILLIQKLVPRIESHSVKEAGHLPQYERPEVVNPILIEFLKK